MKTRAVAGGRPSGPPVRDERKFVAALARGLQILEVFQGGDELGNQDIAERTGLPPATVTRLTYTLTELGYLRHSSLSGKYTAGAGVLGLSATINRNLGVQRAARPYMERLSREFDCSAIMGMRDRISMVFLEVTRPPHSALRVNTDTGSTVPIASTAIGLAYLVAAPLPERAGLLASLRPLYPDDWSAVREDIEKAYTMFRSKGFVVHERSWAREVNAVARPLILKQSSHVYSFMCGGPSQTMPRKLLMEELGPRLVQTVEDIRLAVESSRLTRLGQPTT